VSTHPSHGATSRMGVAMSSSCRSANTRLSFSPPLSPSSP
jgi:hypothetical protein